MSRLLAGSPTPSLYWRLPGGRTKEGIFFIPWWWVGCFEHYYTFSEVTSGLLAERWSLARALMIFVSRAQSWSFQWSRGSSAEVTGCLKTIIMIRKIRLGMTFENLATMTLVLTKRYSRCEADNGFSALPVAKSLLLVVTCEFDWWQWHLWWWCWWP